MTRKQKLELTWVGKDERPRLEPRILLEDASLSYHASRRVTDHDRFDNILIQGDNLLALKALEQEFTGKVKCVFIDPPYNTGSAFEHYDDGVEHSLWLTMMATRLDLLWRLTSEDGLLAISIDEREGHYLKVLCDEICGRAAFIATIVWENFYGRSNAAAISPAHNYILLYSKLGLDWKKVRNLLPRDEKSASKYTNPDGDPRGRWRAGPIFAAEERHDGLMYEITTPSGRKVKPPAGSHWRVTEAEFRRIEAEGRILYGMGGDNAPAVKLFLAEVQDGLVPRSWWPHTEVGHTQEAKRESQALFGADAFETPKPERLLERILHMASLPGDLVLDSFLGSGTTAAVAHKMGRRWIGIEMGNHAVTHCQPRLKMVADGQDPGGVTESTDWCGGGGFRFYHLAPSLLQKDNWSNWVINKEYNPEMLAEAACKLEGFRYAPDPEVFWRQGHSTERDFIYVTTQTLNATQLEWISEQVGPERSLLILANAFLASGAAWPNLTLKKLPNTVLGQCEFGRDDYSLQVAALPDPESSDTSTSDGNDSTATPPTTKKRGRKPKNDPSQEALLDGGRDE